MKKCILFLALLLVVSFGGCSHDEELKDTITKASWRVDYFAEDGNERTQLFEGYVFTFVEGGTVTVTRTGTPPPAGTWDESNSGWRLELYFGAGLPLEKLNEDWVVDLILDDEVRLHELYSPSTQLRFERR